MCRVLNKSFRGIQLEFFIYKMNKKSSVGFLFYFLAFSFFLFNLREILCSLPDNLYFIYVFIYIFHFLFEVLLFMISVRTYK